MSETEADRRAELARAAIDDAVQRLRDAGVAPEPLAEFVPARRVLGVIPRAERVRVTGEGWRLGSLVVSTTGALVVEAATTRAKRPERVGYASDSARARDALRHAAFRGGIPQGRVVHVGGRIVDLDRPDTGTDANGPLGVRGPLVVVRWALGATLDTAAPLAAYLGERVDLCIHPPEGA